MLVMDLYCALLYIHDQLGMAPKFNWAIIQRCKAIAGVCTCDLYVETDAYNLVVDAANLGTYVSPRPEQSTILAEEEHVHLSGHQKPAQLSASASNFSSGLFPLPALLKIAVHQIRANTRSGESCLMVSCRRLAHGHIPKQTRLHYYN